MNTLTIMRQYPANVVNHRVSGCYTVFMMLLAETVHLIKVKTTEVSSSYLHNKVSPTEVSDGARQACATPDEPQEQRPLRVGEGLHHLPEPLNERRRRLHSLVGGHRLQQVERDVGASTHLRRGIHSLYDQRAQKTATSRL